ncbi:MAG: ATP-binding protein [Hyphomonadaceae bacterium]|nr:ATP-binding protein [Hyphomonadaceae bacterium]
MRRRSVANDLAEVGKAVAWADAIALEAGVSDRVRQDLQVCLEEALANLIMHGRADGDKAIAFKVRANPAGVELRIFDRCAPFDVTKAELRQLEAGRSGGAGLRLLRGLASELRYGSLWGRNKLTVILRERTN